MKTTASWCCLVFVLFCCVLHRRWGSVPHQCKHLKRKQTQQPLCCSVLGDVCQLYSFKSHHKDTVRCHTIVVKVVWGEKGERPICNYFLVNQQKVANLRCSTLAWIKTSLWCCWLKEGASSAGTWGERCSISLQNSKTVPVVEDLVIGQNTCCQRLLPLIVLTWTGIKGEIRGFDVFTTVESQKAACYG